jgi:hypothetical protein
MLAPCPASTLEEHLLSAVHNCLFRENPEGYRSLGVGTELPPCLTKHYAMKAYGGVDVLIHVFLISALVGGEWSASRPGRSTPGLGSKVGPGAGLDYSEKSRRYKDNIKLDAVA